jgi:hypothetical protein
MTLRSTIGLASSQVNATNIYAVWKRVNTLKAKIPNSQVKFKINDIVRITKEKVKFANGLSPKYFYGNIPCC